MPQCTKYPARNPASQAARPTGFTASQVAGNFSDERVPIVVRCVLLLKTLRNAVITQCLVGAVGIENNTHRNFKDLQGMRGAFKSLKRNDEGCSETLSAPSKLPRPAPSLEIPSLISFAYRSQQLSALGPNLAARMASRHRYPKLSNRSRKK
jgi:hypothetical protein